MVDVATLFAGPLAARILGDHGAEVIKVEHPRGDPARTHGPAKSGQGLWWKTLSRNKLAITLNLARAEGQDLLRQLVAASDVLIESFRPGVMERWNLGYEQLQAANPRLIMLRVTGFGQSGPYASRPGFGTLAESMSGFAHITGQPDGPPTLPPFGLADGVSGIAGALAVMLALYQRDQSTGHGQMIDLALIEPILHILGAQATVFDQLGTIQNRTGNRSVNNAPRNTYQTSDGHWVAISTSANTVAERVLRLVGHSEVISEPWFATGRERAQHADELDAHVAKWIAQRPRDVVLEEFANVGAAAAPIYNIAEAMADPQYQARESFTTVPDSDLGPMKMENMIFRLMEGRGAIRFTGRHLGQDNMLVLMDRLGMSEQRYADLREQGVI